MDFDKDLFISYAHIDNQSLIPDQEGWISTFHKALAIRLSQIRGTPPKIWRDRKLQGNDDFSNAITEALTNSGLLLSILSPRYLKSEWCIRELQTFCNVATEQTGGLNIGENK
ncbi:MAG: toll/interleukin-1 receptor domain-containing protein, partial [Cyanobacteria bacterium J06627_3]